MPTSEPYSITVYTCTAADMHGFRLFSSNSLPVQTQLTYPICGCPSPSMQRSPSELIVTFALRTNLPNPSALRADTTSYMIENQVPLACQIDNLTLPESITAPVGIERLKTVVIHLTAAPRQKIYDTHGTQRLYQTKCVIIKLTKLLITLQYQIELTPALVSPVRQQHP